MHALRTTRATVCGARDDDDDGGLKFKHMKKQNPYMCVHVRTCVYTRVASRTRERRRTTRAIAVRGIIHACYRVVRLRYNG